MALLSLTICNVAILTVVHWGLLPKITSKLSDPLILEVQKYEPLLNIEIGNFRSPYQLTVTSFKGVLNGIWKMDSKLRSPSIS